MTEIIVSLLIRMLIAMRIGMLKMASRYLDIYVKMIKKLIQPPGIDPGRVNAFLVVFLQIEERTNFFIYAWKRLYRSSSH
jgi:hypothetical protein